MFNFSTADLHLHSSVSDGKYKPAALLRKVAEAGLAAAALTDHDTVAGLNEAREAARRLRIDFVPGVEISAGIGGEEVHLLAYYFDETNRSLATLLAKIREKRIVRAHRIIERLASCGVKITFESVQGEAAVVARPHIAQAMVEAGYVADRSEAFHLYLGEGKPAFVAKETVPAAEAIRVVREAGGVTVIAHPGHIRNQSVVNRLIEIGIDGLEYIHPAHDPETTRHYYEFAKVYRLLPVGGSDYHGFRAQDEVNLGRLAVPVARMEALRRRAAESKTEQQHYA